MEEGLPKVPKLELAQLKFLLSKDAKTTKNAEKIRENLLAEIIKDSGFSNFLAKGTLRRGTKYLYYIKT